MKRKERERESGKEFGREENLRDGVLSPQLSPPPGAASVDFGLVHHLRRSFERSESYFDDNGKPKH